MTTLETYLKQIGQYSLLTEEEEIDLSRTIQTSTNEQEKQKAFEKLVTANLRLVVFCAKSIIFSKENMSLMDVIQEGNKVLMTIARHYNYDKFKVKFSAYALHAIKRRMSDIAMKNRFISIPSDHYIFLKKLFEMKNRFGYDSIEDISFEDFQNQDWIPETTKKYFTNGIFERIKKSYKTSVSFYEDMNPIADTIDIGANPQNNLLEKKGYMDRIILETLDAKEADLINKVFYNGLYMREAGKTIGITKQRVSAHLQKALFKLRARIIRDKRDFEEVPLKWIKVMDGKVKPIYRRSIKSTLKNRFEPIVV